MFTTRPTNWNYNEDMELLWLFFQCSEEMLNSHTVDTYKLPVHNTMSLVQEIKRVYRILGGLKSVDKYYSKYIPVIIDELIASIHNDTIIKHHLGHRLASVINGLTEAKKNHSKLLQWIDQLTQSCSYKTYLNAYKQLIIDTISENKNKTQLLIYCSIYFSGLVRIGYSLEYLHRTLCKFFTDSDYHVVSPLFIEKFLGVFDYKLKEYELIAVVDSYLWKYFCSLDEDFANVIEISEISEESIIKRIEETHSETLRVFLQVFRKQKYGNHRLYIQMITCKVNGLDQYQALSSLNRLFELMQEMQGYFKHKVSQKIIFDSLYVDGNQYRIVKISNTNHHRPVISQDTIDKRISLLLSPEYISRSGMFSLRGAMRLHSDAIDSHNESAKLRAFWIALESLFSDPDQESDRENALYSMLHIIQKTYLLKLLKTLYFQLHESIQDKRYWIDELAINGFDAFLDFFIKHKENSDEFKKIYSMLSDNPLMRTRLFQLRKTLSTGKMISEKLQNHRTRIYWHLMRIYRTRNLSTHAGVTMPYTEEVLYNLHNYFDYAVNFILCKLENGDSINSISSLVFEAKNDNMIHMEILKKDESLDLANGLIMLFGPDQRIVTYDFEFSS